jgi:hypothetical protein
MILLLILKYFSQFVSREALENFFQASSGLAYDQSKEEVLAVQDGNRIPGLDNFIFGINTDAVKTRISSVLGPYLFIDYSNIVSTLSKQDVKTDSFHIAVTVAQAHPNDEDAFAETLCQSECLDILKAIRERMRDDVDIDYSIEWLPFPTTISPFVAKELSNSYGFTMELDLKAIDAV